MDRTEQIDKATQVAYYDSRRPRRSQIVQVPATGATPERMTMRPVLVPFTPKPISWAEARKLGEATGRVLRGGMWGAWPPPEILAKQKDANRKRAELKQQGIKTAERYRKDPRGNWWMNKFADVVERRAVITIPAYSRRARKKDPQDPQPANGHEPEPAADV